MNQFLINKKAKSKGLAKDEYDAIIIGAGIGGLTCGCYLAKAGMKVLIVEQHNKVGGYLTSFSRGKFTFEAGAFEDLREDSIFGQIIQELEIYNKVKIVRSDPNIIIITPDYKIKVRTNLDATIEELQEYFPHQADEIRNFFYFIDNYNLISLYSKCRNKTFDDLLSEYFSDDRLKSIFRIMSSQIGVISSKVAALSVCTYFKTFIINGGYYPLGGLQIFSNAFAERFKEFGGEILLSSAVEKIVVENGKTKGIILKEDDYIPGKYVVSNADATATFLNLVGEKHLSHDFVSNLKSLTPSISSFIVYLGINKVLRDEFGPVHELWDIPTYEIDDPWMKNRLEINFSNIYLYCYLPSFIDSSMAPPNCESIAIGIFTPYFTRQYWDQYRNIFMEQCIERISKVIPQIRGSIVKKVTAIPQTLNRYTKNRSGAFKGWAPLLSQINSLSISSKTPIENLYLAGHWVHSALGETGVPQAAHTGQRVASSIIKRKG